jgi:hypothetical protein
MEAIITDVMVGIDCVEESSDNPEHIYLTISDGVIGLYNMAVRYIPRVFDSRFASSLGMPSEIRIVRMMGYDIVLEVTYLIHREPEYTIRYTDDGFGRQMLDGLNM